MHARWWPVLEKQTKNAIFARVCASLGWAYSILSNLCNNFSTYKALGVLSRTWLEPSNHRPSLITLAWILQQGNTSRRGGPPLERPPFLSAVDPNGALQAMVTRRSLSQDRKPSTYFALPTRFVTKRVDSHKVSMVTKSAITMNIPTPTG